MSGSSHTIGVKDCSNLRVLPVLLHWGCCLDVGPQRKLALMSKLTPPPPPPPGWEGSLKVTLRFRFTKVEA